MYFRPMRTFTKSDKIFTRPNLFLKNKKVFMRYK